MLHRWQQHGSTRGGGTGGSMGARATPVFWQKRDKINLWFCQILWPYWPYGIVHPLILASCWPWAHRILNCPINFLARMYKVVRKIIDLKYFWYWKDICLPIPQSASRFISWKRWGIHQLYRQNQNKENNMTENLQFCWVKRELLTCWARQNHTRYE